MKIFIIGATGMVGRHLTDEAARRGHPVIAGSRTATGDRRWPANVTHQTVDAGDPAAVSGLAAAAEVTVLTVRPPSGQEKLLPELTRSVLDAVAATGSRLLVIGGAGPLRTPDDPGRLVVDDPRYVAPAWADIAAASTAQLRACQQHPYQGWCYLSPPAVLESGERTGGYRRGTTTLLTAADGSSRISVADFAVAVIDELERPSGDWHLTVAGSGAQGLRAGIRTNRDSGSRSPDSDHRSS